MKNKAQAGFELLLTTGFAMMLLIIIVISYSINMEQNVELEKKIEGEKICNKISSAVSYVVSSGPGTNITLSLQDNIKDMGYTATIMANNSLIRITINENNLHRSVIATCKISTRNVTNSAGANHFEVKKSTIIRENDNLVVVFDP